MLERSLQDLKARTEPPKSIPEELSYKHPSNTWCQWCLQDLHARAMSGRSHQYLHKTFSSKDPCTRLCYRTPWRMSARSSQDLFMRTCARSCYRTLQGCQQDLHKIFSWGPAQDHAIGLFKDVSKIFTRSSHKGMFKFMQVPLTGFHPDLPNIFSQDFFCKTLLKSFHISWTSLKDLPQKPEDLSTTISENLLKSAPRHNKSDPTHAKCQDNCTSQVKLRTAPHGAQSAESERVAQAISKRP